MMLMMMALVDTDTSGTLSLEEVQAVHARMFQYADTDDDGELTIDELRAFMHGEGMPGAQ
jgi:EF hand